jgi:hypothetical protein
MTACIGPDDISIYESPRPTNLREITALDPVEAGTHVRLDSYGVRSTQRLAVGDIGGSIVLALWPAELKEQALYVYGRRLGRPMIRAAQTKGWSAEPAPQLAFRNSRPSLRLYMQPRIDVLEYARRWEEEDLGQVGAHRRSRIRSILWPWLKSRGFVADLDDAVLELWMSKCLGRRDAFLRPGLRLKRSCGPADTPASLRREIDAILAAAADPPLPAR